MATIEISREQLAYVEALREELEDEMPYGQVRNLDAVQYLIDHHRDDGDLDVDIDADLEAELDQEEAADGGTTVETGADAGQSSGIETDDADAGGVDDADAGDVDDADAGDVDDPDAGNVDEDVDEGNSPGGGGSSGGTDASEGAPTPDPGTVAASGDGSDGGETTRISGGPDPSQLSGASGDDTLNEMMNLLEDHEDVWEESGAGEAKYQVELPDGDVESAATKDDVRALLFKHYR